MGKPSSRRLEANTPHYSSDHELKRALREEKAVIVIKDQTLSNQTVLWMTSGQCLRHMTLATAMGAVMCSGMNDKLGNVARPLAVGSFLMNVAYHYFWHNRPLHRYRLAQGPSIQDILDGTQRTNTVIVRRVANCSSAVHTFASTVAVVVAFWKDIRSLSITERLVNIIKKTEEKLEEQEPKIRRATEKVKEAFQ
ncbi:hypothetical protein HNY73_000210 [Argiope bruennichi]|uniref:Uncharacterized protein n=1 Tax=Argiope bruennichi TaxID=94029 RepID=A0A8T0FXC4_ARGBR|nr:hypothetical protein HNY73_000210 [Argiope bruennichi]